MLEPKAQALRKSAEMDPWTGVGLADSLPQPARQPLLATWHTGRLTIG